MVFAYPVITAFLLFFATFLIVTVTVIPYIAIDDKIVLRESSELRPKVRALTDSWLIFFLDKSNPGQTKIAHKRVHANPERLIETQVIIDSGFDLLLPAFSQNGGCVTVFCTLVPEEGEEFRFDQDDISVLKAQVHSNTDAPIEDFQLCDQ